MTKTIKGTSKRPRLYIFRSNKHIYAQIIDDTNNRIIASSSSTSKNIKNSMQTYATCITSQQVGKDIAIKLQNKGINKIVFDRGNKRYHGRIKALAEAARKAGMNF